MQILKVNLANLQIFRLQGVNYTNIKIKGTPMLEIAIRQIIKFIGSPIIFPPFHKKK